MNQTTRWKRLEKAVLALGLLAMLWGLTNPLLGAEAAGNFRTPHPFAQIWARAMGLSLVSAAAALIL